MHQMTIEEWLSPQDDRMVEISQAEAVAFLLPRHYSGRKPSISKAFGWYKGQRLMAVITFGKPASPAPCLCCDEKWHDNVYELNRLCREEDLDEPLSKFVAWSLKQLRPLNWIILSYSDTAMNHHGYIYQATNFLYTGCTKPRTDMYTQGGKHPRHAKEEDQQGLRKVRSAKHRYVFFCTSNKKLKKEWQERLHYPILPYPKGDNSTYRLGEYLVEGVVKDRRIG